MQSKCKIYVAKRVWDDHSVRLRDLEPGAAKHSREEAAHTAEALSGTAALTTLRCGMVKPPGLRDREPGFAGMCEPFALNPCRLLVKQAQQQHGFQGNSGALCSDSVAALHWNAAAACRTYPEALPASAARCSW